MTTRTCVALLRTLHGHCDGVTEFRTFKPGDSGPPSGRAFIQSEDENSLTFFIGSHLREHNYFGVATRRDGSSGTLENCSQLPALFVDLDFKHTPEPVARQRLAECPFAPSAIVNSGNGLHVYWLLNEPFDLQDQADRVRAASLLRRLAYYLDADVQAAEPARVLRLPGTQNFKYDPPRHVVVELLDPARQYNVSEFDDLLPAEPITESRPSFVAPETICDGERNATLFKAARSMKAKHYSREAIREALKAENRVKCEPPLPDSEVEDIVESAWTQPDRAAFVRHEKPDEHAHAGPATDHGDSAFPLTDSGNAEWFAASVDAAVRYDHRRARWRLWRQHHWQPDADADIHRRAKTAIRLRLSLSATLEDLDARRALAKWALGSESRARLDSLLTLAQAEHPIADAGEHWDRDPFVLGVPNGVVDLRTGQLRAGLHDDRITMNATVPFDSAAACPRWELFVQEIFDGDPKLTAFLQRAIGYSLTGDTGEQCLFLCYGVGANGKGTLTNTILRVLGDYAWNMPFSTIELHQRAAIPNDVAALVGRRFVVASETNDGTRLNESRVKALTGCDPLTARFLHGEFFTFEPVAKFWLSVNHKPVVRDDSHGFWRRIRLIPFLRQFPLNLTLADELRGEAPGILAWAVRGCVAWQHEGLNPPESVTNATEEYQRESDPLAAFMDEACELSADATTKAKDFYDHYKHWAEEHGLTDRERLTSTMFGRKMSERFSHERTRSGKLYFGVSLRVL